jgi:hypothetical protein
MARDDISCSKAGEVVQNLETEKDFSDSPVDSVSVDPEHVTAKTWIVIFVSCPVRKSQCYDLALTSLRSSPRLLDSVSGLFPLLQLCRLSLEPNLGIPLRLTG